MARLPYDGYRADQWSLAVALFAMVSGFFPVEEATQRDWRFSRLAMLQLRGPEDVSTTNAIYSFYTRPCPLSPALVELLDGILMIQPPRRMALDAVARTPWVTGGPSAAPNGRLATQPMAIAPEIPGACSSQVEAVEMVNRSGGDVLMPSSEPPRVCRQRACSQHVGAEMDGLL